MRPYDPPASRRRSPRWIGPPWGVNLLTSAVLCSVTLAAAVASEAVPRAASERDPAQITIHANQTLHRLSRYLTGACLEDVNHEIYGGLYSQMIFGESFQEPPDSAPVAGFKAYAGDWEVQDGELRVGGGDGPKLVSERPAFSDGEVGVDIFLADRRSGNAGLIVKVNHPGSGADSFDGYEVSLDAEAGVLRLGRHRQNWELIRDTPCAVPVAQWIPLAVTMTGNTLEVGVNGRSVIRYEEREHPLRSGQVGVRTWQRAARFRNLWVRRGGTTTALPFRASPDESQAVSQMWRVVRRGSAVGQWTLDHERAFLSGQSQRVTFVRGDGEIGVENQGLNRWGMCFLAGKPYEGYVWVRGDTPTELRVTLESRDGRKVYAASRLTVTSNDWQRLDFALTPNRTDQSGRFTIALPQPGSVVLGHAFLQTGAWGRFHGLPVRRDVAEALVDEGVMVLRYGGSMVNALEYRWKKMIGPRDLRPPYRGTWYPHSSNGWGILDFLDFCRAAGFLAIPAFNIDETPQDMADFMEYVNGSGESAWGRRRVAAGHPDAYGLKYLELGNEERVDESYWQKFQPLAQAIWAKDPRVILVVGDFFYSKVITDPFHFDGGAVKTLAAHKKILDLARAHGREVWFDVHIGTEQPPQPGNLAGERSFIAQLGRLSPGTRYKVAIFEFNAGNHALKRALANACALNQVERIGDKLPIACSANCLQPDGQNDNGWDQGLLFLNPSQVWLQPPGYVTRMVSHHYLPVLVETEVQGADGQLDANAKRSEDGRKLVLQVVNLSDRPSPARIHLDGFVPSKSAAAVEELTGPLDAVNTAEAPRRIQPRRVRWRLLSAPGEVRYTFPPHSFTVLQWE